MEVDDENIGQKIGKFAIEFVMSMFYIAFGYVLLFTTVFDNSSIQKELKIGVGIILGVYGLFRIYRICKSLTVKKNK